MGGSNSVIRQAPTGASGLSFQAFRILFVLAVSFYILCMLALSLSGPSINYCAAKARLQFLTNSTLTDDCQAEAAGGDTGCVKDVYKENRWRHKEWYFIHLPLSLGILAGFSLIVFMMFEAVRILWWIGAIWLTLLGIAIGVCVIFMVIYTVQCKTNEFCLRLVEAFDITTYVKHGLPDFWWLVHVIAAGLLCISFCFIFGSSLFLQNSGAFASMAVQFSQANRPAE